MLILSISSRISDGIKRWLMILYTAMFNTVSAGIESLGQIAYYHIYQASQGYEQCLTEIEPNTDNKLKITLNHDMNKLTTTEEFPKSLTKKEYSNIMEKFSKTINRYDECILVQYLNEANFIDHVEALFKIKKEFETYFDDTTWKTNILLDRIGHGDVLCPETLVISGTKFMVKFLQKVSRTEIIDQYAMIPTMISNHTENRGIAININSIPKINGKLTLAAVEYYENLSKTTLQAPLQASTNYTKPAKIELQTLLTNGMLKKHAQETVEKSKWTTTHCKLHNIESESWEVDGQERTDENLIQRSNIVHDVNLENNDDVHRHLSISYNSEIPYAMEADNAVKYGQESLLKMEESKPNVPKIPKFFKPFVKENEKIEEHIEHIKTTYSNKNRFSQIDCVKENENAKGDFVNYCADQNSKRATAVPHVLHSTKYKLHTSYFEEICETINWENNGDFCQTSHTHVKCACTSLVPIASPKNGKSSLSLDLDAAKKHVMTLLDKIEKVELPSTFLKRSKFN